MINASIDIYGTSIVDRNFMPPDITLGSDPSQSIFIRASLIPSFWNSGNRSSNVATEDVWNIKKNYSEFVINNKFVSIIQQYRKLIIDRAPTYHW